ncbi:MAG: hypothetical protein ACKOYJ_05790 [Planctomycetia bacterium]
MAPVNTALMPTAAPAYSSHAEQERERLRRELLRRILEAERRRQAVRLSPR